MQKSKSKPLRKIKKRKKISLKKRSYEHQIKILRKRVSRLKQKLTEKEPRSKKTKRIRKFSIRYKIRSGNLEDETIIFSKLMWKLRKLAQENNLKLRFEVKEGCLFVILYVLLPLGISIGGAAVYDFLKKAISRLSDTPSVEVTQIPSHYKEGRAKEMHRELDRSYKGIVSRESIESDNRKGTQFKIRDNNNMDWSYDIFDNGDEYSHH